jgi:hypothetical protein
MGFIVHAREGLEPFCGVLFEAYVTKTFSSHGCF